jgi:hypothetical protein
MASSLDTLVTIGPTRLYDALLASTFDSLTMAELDEMLIDDLIGAENAAWQNGSMEIDHQIDGRSTTSIIIFDEEALLAFNQGQQIRITDLNNVEEFAGLVQSAKKTKLPGAFTFLVHTIEAADFWAILDRRLVVYVAADTLAGDAVRAIWAEYLVSEGITLGIIEDGELLTEISFNYKTAGEAFDKLASACDNFICYLDYQKKLYFHRRTLYAAPWSLSDRADFLKDSMNITYGNPNYRNTEIVLGGSEETDIQTETFVSDGITKSWPLGYKANRMSSITVTPPGGGDPVNKTFGAKGTDAGSYDFYWAKQSETLTAEASPIAGSQIEVQYYGLFSVITKAEDGAAIAANVAREGGGSGIVEHVTIDQTLNSITAAGEYANAKIAEYGRDGILLQYDTIRGGPVITERHVFITNQIATPNGNLKFISRVGPGATIELLGPFVPGSYVVDGHDVLMRMNPGMTAAQLLEWMNSVSAIANVMEVELPPGSDGSGVIDNLAKTNLDQMEISRADEELAAGNLQNVSVAGLNEDFLITHVRKKFLALNLKKWSIEAVSGPVNDQWEVYFRDSFTAVYEIREGVEDGGTVTKLYGFSKTFLTSYRPNPFTLAYPGVTAGSDTWPCFDPSERFEYISFFYQGSEVYRKQFTQVLNEATDDATSIAFIGPAEALGSIDAIGFWGGNSCSGISGSGVELYHVSWNHLKTILESLQINCAYHKGA